jgi:hypothetical protein
MGPTADVPRILAAVRKGRAAWPAVAVGTCAVVTGASTMRYMYGTCARARGSGKEHGSYDDDNQSYCGSDKKLHANKDHGWLGANPG